jgi:hypothetical protein
MDGPAIRDYESTYTQIQGTGYESDLAKIILRYQNEGRAANPNQNLVYQ